MWFAMQSRPPRVVRLTMSTPGANALGENHNFSITPDGSRVVYRSQNQILVRALDQQQSTPLGDATNATSLFMSPDSQWVGFFDGAALKKIAINGGAAITLSPGDGTTSRGATWGTDGTIVFATFSGVTGLQQMSADGGKVTVLTTPGQKTAGVDHAWPEFLPGGRAVLFTIIDPSGNPPQVAVLDLQTAEQTVLLRGASDGKYLPTGHLLYRAGGALHTVPFDVDRLEIDGNPIPVLEDMESVGLEPFQRSCPRAVPRLPAGHCHGRREAQVGMGGQAEPRGVDRGATAILSVPAPVAGRYRVALASNDEQQDMWVWDLRRATLTRLTFDPANDLPPVWTPDNRRLAFSSTRVGGQFNLFIQAVDGTGSVTRLTESPNQQNPTSMTPDGMHVLFNEVVPDQGRNLRMLTLIPTPHVESLLATRFEERGAVVSPDGRWLAYESNTSGRFEIYVRPFPAVDEGQWQLSTAGGVQPLWSRDGRELFYVAPNGGLMTVLTETTASVWSAGRQRLS